MNAQRIPSPPPLDAERPYVLLVESESEDEALAQRILRKYRISNQVEWVRDAEEALRTLRDRLSPAKVPPAGRPAPDTLPTFTRARRTEEGGASLLPTPESGPGSSRPDATAPDSQAAGPSRTSAAPAGRPPELILLDYRPFPIPVQEQIRRFRELPGMASVPIACCCRTPLEEKAIRDAALHRVSCLSKPIGFFKLLECIQKMDMHWFVFAEKP
jgi:CheY-like chemotaxis protein